MFVFMQNKFSCALGHTMCSVNNVALPHGYNCLWVTWTISWTAPLTLMSCTRRGKVASRRNWSALRDDFITNLLKSSVFRVRVSTLRTVFDIFNLRKYVAASPPRSDSPSFALFTHFTNISLGFTLKLWPRQHMCPIHMAAINSKSSLNAA